MSIGQKQFALALLTALSSSSALALVGGSVDDNTSFSDWAGVGSISIGGNYYSGVMLDSTHVLTAAHVVFGQESTASNVSFSLNAGSLSQTLTASSISVHSGYTGTPAPDKVWHDDLAVITLSSAITGVSGYGLYSGSMSGQTITMVGYGGTGPTVKKVGENVVDLVLKDDDGAANNTNWEVFAFDFDGPDKSSNSFGNDNTPSNQTLGADIEAQYTSGDSGSPVFIKVNGVWQIAGIGTFSTGQNYGDQGGGTIVKSYIPWITEQMAAPVPEPQTWAMLLVGMGLVGAAVRAKARA